jgi:diaminopimelate decarboxylase
MSSWPTETLLALADEHGTPLYVLDLDRVRAQLRMLQGFDVVRYAQKANPGSALLSALAHDGLSVDAVSAGEVVRALRAGFPSDRIELVSDVFDREALAQVGEHGVRANLGSADLIEPYADSGAPHDCTLRINPGFGAGHDRKVTTGGPASKHGIWHTELGATCQRAHDAGLEVTGLHVHIGSGVELENLERMIGVMGGLLREAPGSVKRVSAGGGLPMPYRAEDEAFPVARYVDAWRTARQEWRRELGRDITLEVEPGRFLVASAGVLITEVRARKRTPHWDWVLVDAGFHTLARPMLYGAFHRISALGDLPGPVLPRVVAGPLCEASDVLTQDKDGTPTPQPLPDVRVGDRLCIHDAGAYGISMASNYNGFPLPAEIVLQDGAVHAVRPRQTLDAMLAADPFAASSSA